MVRRALVVFLALATVRCGGDKTYNYYYGGDSGPNSGDSGAGQDGLVHVESCTPDPTRIQALEPCRADDQCPCGTACNNGQCTAQCTSPGAPFQYLSLPSLAHQCPSGQRCDTFGRCRDASDTATVGPLQAQTAGTLSVYPAYIESLAALDIAVAVRSDNADMTDARIQVSDGLEASCDGGASFGSICNVPALAAGVDGHFELRTTSNIADGEVRTVQVFGGSQLVTVTVVRQAPDYTAPPAPQTAGAPQALRAFATAASAPIGSYSGRALLRDIGSLIVPPTTLPEVTGSAPSRDFVVPLTAEIYANTAPSDDTGYFTVVLHDPSQILLPTGQIIGVMKGHGATPDYYNLEFHAQPWVTTTFVSAADALGASPEYSDVRARYRYLVEAANSSYTVPATADIKRADVAVGHIGFDVITQYDIADTDQDAPKTRWSISLGLLGGLPEGATVPAEPAYTIADTPALPPARFLVPSLWEARVAASIPATDPRTVARTWLRRDTNLGACKLPTIGMDTAHVPSTDFGSGVEAQAYGQLYNEFWMYDDAGNVAVPTSGTTPVTATSSRTVNWIPGMPIPYTPSLVQFQLHPMVRDMIEPARQSVFNLSQVIAVVDIDSITVPFRQTSIDTPLDGAGADMVLREVPCALDAEAGSMNSSYSIPVPRALYDRCDEIAQVLHCDVRDLSAAEQAQPSAVITHAFNVGQLNLVGISGSSVVQPYSLWKNASGGSTRKLTVTRVCTMPSVPMVCAELAACDGGRAGVNSALLQDDFRTSSGDAVCGAGDHGFGVEADVNSGQLSATEMLATCLDDAGHLVTPPIANAPLATTLATNGCASIGGLLFAMGAASDTLRKNVIAPAGIDALQASSLLSQRLFVRFADVFGFIARESAETEKFAPVVRRETLAGSTSVPQTETALSTSLRGWSALFAPRFQVAMQQLTGVALLDPDYRSLFGAVPSGSATGPLDPLPLALLRASEAQLDLANVVVQRSSGTTATSALASAGEALRYALVAEALAHDLVDRAIAANGGMDPAWGLRYRDAESSFVAARDALQSSMAVVASAGNFLDIAESDVPLYFTGGQVTDDSRYFAISDYLIGTTAGSVDNWAPSLIDDASHKLDVARDAWLEREARIVQNSHDEAERQARIANVAASYGEQIIKLCGDPAGLAPADVLSQWSTFQGAAFNPNNCWVDRSNSSCYIDSATYGKAVTAEAVQFQAALAQSINAIAEGSASIAAAADQLDAQNATAAAKSDEATAALLNCPPTQVGLDACPGGQCVSCGGVLNPEALLSAIEQLQIQAEDTIQPALLQQAITNAKSQFPQASAALPTATGLSVRPTPKCFRGDIGDQQTAIQAITSDVGTARAALDDAKTSYNLAFNACARLKTDSVAGFLAAQQYVMQEAFAKLQAATASANTTATTLQDCNISAQPLGFYAFRESVGCQQQYATSSRNAVLLALNTVTSTVNMPVPSAQEAYSDCVGQAQQHLVDVNTQTLRVQRAMDDLAAAKQAMTDAKAQAQRAWQDGQAAVVAEQNRTLTPMDSDVWTDQRIDSYLDAMRLAQRVTYLAVRAVEYEFQQSLAARGAVLAAQVPDDLTDALRELQTYTAPRTVRGSKPTNKKAVVSLRDSILHLLDTTSAPANNHLLTASERLRLALTSPRYAKFDASGNYLGQQVPFTVLPTGFGTTSAAAVEIYSQDSCAEKIWSVNASILGTSLLRGSTASFTNMTVLKSNTFSSQWCDATGRDSDLQVVAVHPERNLFQDPTAGSPDFIDAQLAGADTQFSKALIQPSLNVPRAQFEDDSFGNGDSSQLAARGLYGEYALFFPAQVLSQASASGITDGLDLTHVDDILVRFDYVTVAR